MWKRVLGDTNYENLRRVEKEVGAKRFLESEDRAKRQELMDETVDIICRSVRDLSPPVKPRFQIPGPVGWLLKMAESGMPDRLLPAVRLAVFWISLPFIFLLVAVERYFDIHGNGYQIAACVGGAFLSILIAVYWDKLIPLRLLWKRFLQRPPASQMSTSESVESAPALISGRSFNLSQQRQFAQLLKEHIPDPGDASIWLLDSRFTALGRQLSDVFKSAGWSAQFNDTPQTQARYFEGIVVSGVNGLRVNSICDDLRKAGLSDARPEIVQDRIPRENAKWRHVQNKVEIRIGHESIC